MTAYASSTARTVFVGIPNQSVVGPALALEVERRQRAFGADPLEHPLGHLGVLGEELRGAFLLRYPRNHGNSLVGTRESPLLYASKISRRS